MAVNKKTGNTTLFFDVPGGSDELRRQEHGDGSLYVPVGTGELLELLQTGMIPGPAIAAVRNLAGCGVDLDPVSADGIPGRLARMGLPRYSFPFLLELNPDIGWSNPDILPIGALVCIHVPGEDEWKRTKAKFLQGSGWTQADLSMPVSVDLFPRDKPRPVMAEPD